MQDHNTNLPSRSVAVVLGTRPEIIKLAHVISGLGDAARVIHTGQHYDWGLSRSFLDAFELGEPDLFLGIGGATRVAQIGTAVSALGDELQNERPEWVVVQGDTNSTLAGALAANALEIPLAHVEAGLRSRDRRMPEEHNRVLTDHLADALFAPTETCRENLEGEGIEPSRVRVTGNTVVEAVASLLPEGRGRAALLEQHGLEPGGYVLSTFHRPENVDDPVRFSVVLGELASLPLPVVLSLHPRSRDRAERFGLGLDGVRVLEPLGYREFLGLSAESAYLVSDSGGVQEEASVYKRPVIVVRRSTERPEVIGTFARLVEPAEIGSTARSWLSDPGALHAELESLPSPYGDGSASRQVVDALEDLGV